MLSRTELEFDIEYEFVGALDGVSNIRLVGRCLRSLVPKWNSKRHDDTPHQSKQRKPAGVDDHEEKLSESPS